MAELQPIGPISYALGSQTPTDFERLIWRLVRLDHPAVRFLDNPDGGVDALLPSDDGRHWVRSWQAKRYTSSIKWGDCEQSLDAAVANYRVRQVTFCFPRNLTGPQEQTFVRRLAKRHEGVSVDWIGAEVLQAKLTDTSQGDRVARFFFGAPFYDKEAMERAVALGGKVETPQQALTHLGKVQGAFKDPYFLVRSATHETGDEHVAPPDTVFSLMEQQGDVTARLDVAPRDEEAMSLFGPRFSLGFTEDESGRRAQEAVHAALARQEAARIEGGVRIVFERYPEFLEQVLGQPLTPDAIEITPLQPVLGLPPRWAASLGVEGATDIGHIAVDLEPQEPVDSDWDAEFVGGHGGLEVRVRSRWRDGRGEMNFRLRHQLDESPTLDQVASLRLLRELAAGGLLVVSDRGGTRPTLRVGAGPSDGFDERSSTLLGFLEDVALIEGRSGLTLSLPEDLDPEEYARVRELARALRTGEIAVSFDSTTLEVDSEGLAKLRAGGQLVATYPDMRSNVLGSAVPLQASVSLEPYEVREVDPVEGEPGRFSVQIGPPLGHEGSYSLKVETAPRDG